VALPGNSGTVTFKLSLAKTLSALRNTSVPRRNGGDRELNRRPECPKAPGFSQVVIQNGRSHEKGRRNPLVFLERALAWITQRDRSDGAVHRVGPEKGCDLKSRNEFCYPVFLSQVPSEYDPRGSNEHIQKEVVSSAVH
jgi:hypothetical protein